MNPNHNTSTTSCASHDDLSFLPDGWNRSEIIGNTLTAMHKIHIVAELPPLGEKNTTLIKKFLIALSIEIIHAIAGIDRRPNVDSAATHWSRRNRAGHQDNLTAL
jgi:hypothetical protein